MFHVTKNHCLERTFIDSYFYVLQCNRMILVVIHDIKENMKKICIRPLKKVL